MSALFVDQQYFNESTAGMSEFARCANCILESATIDREASRTPEEAANAQWMRCAECRASGSGSGANKR